MIESIEIYKHTKTTNYLKFVGNEYIDTYDIDDDMNYIAKYLIKTFNVDSDFRIATPCADGVSSTLLFVNNRSLIRISVVDEYTGRGSSSQYANIDWQDADEYGEEDGIALAKLINEGIEKWYE